jgi:transposase
LIAVMHKLAIAIWRVLAGKAPYHDLDADYLAQRDLTRAMRRITAQANTLGLTVRFDPIGA